MQKVLLACFLASESIIGHFFIILLQILLQVLIILTGNYNFFNLLTLTLCLSLLDDQHVIYWLRKAAKTSNNGTIKLQGLNTRAVCPFCHHRTPYVPCSESKPLSWLCCLLELLVWALLILGTIVCFDLQLDTSKKAVSSRTGVCVCVCLFLDICD